jgi:tripartite-type tricarboxylate transporter receptor subunit TctC
MHRRTLFVKTFAIASVAASGCLAGAAHAQAFPNKPITLIVPFTAGGSSDVHLRALADQASKILGQPIVIDNKPGAVGTLGPSLMATTAKPDGYTIGMVSLAVFRQPFIQKVSYDPLKDFTYIIGLSGYTYGLVVKADSPYKTLADLLADAKAKPGQVSYGTTGVGTPQHIAMEQLARSKGIQLLHIPFKGLSEGNNALMGGHLSAIAGGTSWAQQVDNGQFRLLATFGEKRTRKWSSVPTLKELGYGISESALYGIAGPKGMRPEVVKTLHDAFRKAMDTPEHKTVLEKLEQDQHYMSPEEFTKFAAAKTAEMKVLVDKLGLKGGGQ